MVIKPITATPTTEGRLTTEELRSVLELERRIDLYLVSNFTSEGHVLYPLKDEVPLSQPVMAEISRRYHKDGWSGVVSYPDSYIGFLHPNGIYLVR